MKYTSPGQVITSFQSSGNAEMYAPQNMFKGKDPSVAPPGSMSISDILDEARTHLIRLSPTSAYNILHNRSPEDPPSILIDIRPLQQRQLEGEILGAVIIERNVLEWRLDPKSDARLDFASRWDLRAIVFCSEGYTSSLAARSLQSLGLLNATDLEGGYKAWDKEGLGGVPAPQDRNP